MVGLPSAMRLREVVAQNLRRLRRERGMSQEELAHRAGVNRNYIGMLERAENAPTVDMLERLAAVLQIDATAFFVRSEQAEASTSSIEL